MQIPYTTQRGYTLIELVMVIVLIAILAAIASTLLGQGFKAFISAQNVSDADWQGRVAMERMVRDIRAIRSTGDISTASASQLVFTDVNGNSFSYQLSGNTLMLNSQVLANGISSLTFSYQTLTGATTTTISAIRYVTFTITVTQKTANYSLTTSVFLRDVV